MSPNLNDAASIARVSLHDPAHFGIQHSQTLHRLALLKHWDIPAGSKVLELGCGQGDCTTVLACAVGEHGSVVAVDPADLDYGAPYTLGQAQSHISQGPLGPRITWVQQKPLDYISSLSPSSSPAAPPPPPPFFDTVVLAHSLWYFSSPALILSTFSALQRHRIAKRLLLAEWSLSASSSAAAAADAAAAAAAAQPHVLAALTQAALECRKRENESESNVRTVLSPRRIAELAGEAGWTLELEVQVPASGGGGEEEEEPEPTMLDGQWEVGACLSGDFEREVEEHFGCGGEGDSSDDGERREREKAVVMALRDACEASLKGVEGGLKGVRCMDVWVASFV